MGFVDTTPPEDARRRDRFGGIASAALALFTVFWLTWALAANIDAANGGYVLFMDEVVSHAGVTEIQNSSTFEQLTNSVIGTDQRYGRPMWYLPAFVTAPFEEMGNGRGGIVATRMFHAIALFAALLLTALALMDRWVWRAAAVISASVLPFSAYYATMPKPEPLQLLFLATFIWLVARKQQNLGWSWIFLGLAFGMKISALPALPALMFLGFAREWAAGKPKLLLRAIGAGMSFIAGLLLAVPVLVTRPDGWRSYLGGTWGNTGHFGSDDLSVTPWTWFEFMNTTGFFAPAGWTTISVAAILLGVLLAFGATVRDAGGPTFVARARAFVLDRRFASLLVFAAGLLLMASIMIGVKRLWGFYLFPGAALVLVATFALIEQSVHRPTAPAAGRWSAGALGALIFVAAYVGGSKDTFATFKMQAHRSDQPEFLLQMERHAELTRTAEALAQRLGRPVRVLFRATFFYPESTDMVRYDPYYGLRDIWNDGFDIVFLGPDEDPEAVATRAGGYAQEVRDFIGRRNAHLAPSPSAPCAVEPCYIVLPMESEGMFAWGLAENYAEAPAAKAAETTPAR